jgi:uncharacterized membrane protein
MSDTGSNGPGAVAPTEGRGPCYVAYGLLISGFFTFGLGSLIAVIISATQAGSKDPVLASHYRSHVRIFLISAIGFVIFIVLCILSGLALYAPFALAGLVALMGAGAWVAILAVIGISKLSDGKMAGKPAVAKAVSV